MTLTESTRSVELRAVRSGAMVRAAIVGGLCGLAWAGALRAMMAELARPSRVAWSGTFVAVLIPGAIAGALLAVAWARGTAGRTHGMRWFTLAPLTFALGIVVQPGFFAGLMSDALGLGGLVFPALMIVGGFAIGGRGPRWARASCGLLAGALVVAMVAALPMVGGPALALTEPRGAWLASLAASLTLLAMIAVSIPFRYTRTSA